MLVVLLYFIARRNLNKSKIVIKIKVEGSLNNFMEFNSNIHLTVNETL